MNTKEIKSRIDEFDAQIDLIQKEKDALIKGTARARIDELIKIHEAAETGWDRTLNSLLDCPLMFKDENKNNLVRFLDKHLIPYKISSKRFSGGDEYDGHWSYYEYVISLDI